MGRNSVRFLVVMAAISLGIFLLPGCQSSGGGGAGSSIGSTFSSLATGGSIEVPSPLPSDIEAFRTWRNSVADSPKGGAAAFLVALYIYTQNQDLGLQCLTVQINTKFLAAGNAYKGKKPHNRYIQNWRNRVLRKPYIAASYFQGTSPDNGYELPSELEIEFKESRDEGDNRAKVFVYSTGADSARPITLVQNNRGIWKAHEWSSVEVGVRPPKGPAVDDDL